MPTDIKIENHGSLFLFRLLTKAAREWVDENVATEGWEFMGNGLAVEHRMAAPLVEGMLEAGLVLA
jgi:hypothetical protein